MIISKARVRAVRIPKTNPVAVFDFPSSVFDGVYYPRIYGFVKIITPMKETTKAMISKIFTF